MSKCWLILLIVFMVVSRLSAQDTCIKTTEGKEFWFGFMENRLGFSCPYPVQDNYLEVTVTSRFNCQFTITLGKSSIPVVQDVLQPNIPKRYKIDRTKAEPYGSENIEEKALHLLSDQPLNLYAMNWGINSADAAVIYPVESLGYEYFAICYDPHVYIGYANLCSTFFFNGKNSEFVVVASENQTQVTITPSKITDQLKPANVPYTITLNKGELYQVQSNNLNQPGQGDLTGSFIKSNKPIALYSGSWATTVPVSSESAWDHLYEQIPPVRSWGRKFVAVPLKTRGKDTYRILASVDQTTVRIANKTTIVLDKGKFYEFMLNQNEASLIESDHPVLLAQYSVSNDVDRPANIPQGPDWDGDPSMLIVSPVDHTRESATFVAYDTPEITTKFFVNVVTKDDAVSKIRLDGNPITFTSLPNSGYSFAQVQIPVGNHNLNSLEAGKGFIAYVYGFGGVESYGYGVGYNLSTRLDLGGDIHFAKDTIVLCSGETKILDAGSQFSTFLWKPGGETTQKISVSKKGFYEVTASTSDGCVLTAGIQAIESNPVVNLGKDTIVCAKQWVLDGGTGFTSWLWSTNETTRKITVKTTGIFSVIAENKFGCRAKDAIQVGFNQIPKLNLSKLDTLICGTRSSTVNITADKGSYTLSSKDASVSIKDLTATVPQYGTYPFSFTARDGTGCAADTSFTIGFHKLPAVGFDVNDSSCYATSIEAHYIGDANISKSKFTWVFASDTLANQIGKDKIQLQINQDQKNRKLYLKVTDAGCYNAHEINDIKIIPDVGFTVSDTLVCEMEEVKFTASVSGNVTVYHWDWGDGTSEISGKVASHRYQKSGNYTVKLTITNDSKCSGSVTRINLVTVAPVPTVSFSITENQCLDAGVQTLAYTGTGSESARYNWDLSGLLPGEIIQDPGHSRGPMVFDLKSQPKAVVSLQVISNLGCSSETKSLQLKRKPSFTAEASKKSGCVPLVVDFQATSNSPNDKIDFLWNFGNGTSGSGSPVSYTYLSGQSYDVKIIAASQITGCRDTATKSQWISVFPLPDASFSVQKSQQCMNEVFKFKANDNGSGALYDWNMGDGTKASGIEATHMYGKEGQFDVSLAVTTAHGCSAQTTVPDMVFVAPIPTIGFSLDPAMCLEPGSNKLNYVGSAGNKDQFIWNLTGLDPKEIIQSPGMTAGPLIFDLINKPSAKISLQVVSQYGCKSEEKTLTVKRKPVFTFESDVKAGCIPLPIRYKAIPGDQVDRLDFQWNFGDGGNAAGKEVTHQYLIPDQSRDLSVNAVSKITGCSLSLEEKEYIKVYPSPKAGFSFSPKDVYNDQAMVEFLDQSTGALRFEWSFGDNTFSTQPSPWHQYEKIGVKKIVQTVYNQLNCADSASAELTVALRKIFTPNAFSPNAINPVDREFRPYANGVRQEGYHLRIRSRWNDLVFECKNEIKGWNGKMANGTWAPAGNYIWILDYTDFLGEVHRQMGTVTLIY